MQQVDDTLARFAPALANEEPAMAGTTIVDELYLNEVIDGDNELLAELVLLFGQDFSSYRQMLFDAIGQNDRPLFNQIAHKFRSSLNSLAMLETAKKLRDLETNDMLNEPTKATHLADLFEEISQGLLFLKQRTGQLSYNS